MSLMTFEMPYHEGRVCYATDAPAGCNATVECPGDMRAFRFVYDRRHPLRVGDWVRFRGSVRLNMRIKKNGEPEEIIEYYHEPYDGSERLHWAFFQMQPGTEVQIIAPPDVSHTLKETMVDIRRHVDSWNANSDAATLRKTMMSLEKSMDALRPILRRQEVLEADRGAKIDAIDITV